MTTNSEEDGSVELRLATVNQIVRELHSRFSTVVVLACAPRISGANGHDTHIRFVGDVTAAIGLCSVASHLMLNNTEAARGEGL